MKNNDTNEIYEVLIDVLDIVESLNKSIQTIQYSIDDIGRKLSGVEGIYLQDEIQNIYYVLDKIKLFKGED